MNYIEVRPIKTKYNYSEFYWVIDGKPITEYMDNHKPRGFSECNSFMGLLPSWCCNLIWQGEIDFVCELV